LPPKRGSHAHRICCFASGLTASRKPGETAQPWDSGEFSGFLPSVGFSQPQPTGNLRAMTLAAPTAPNTDPRKSSKVGDALARNTVFKVLSPERRQVLADCGCYVHLDKGAKLFGRGDASDAAYAIVLGEVEVTVEGLDGREVFLARL